ncbi:MAG TPA: LysE family translocator [Candidatus Thermoplasmatota archaeon]|nr:LysE family translocator [Candidatus Thermoplasmatota archaeon]
MVSPVAPEALLLLALLTLSPGPDTVLTLRQAITRGERVAVATAAGISLGTIVHASLSGAGLSLLLRESPGAFGVLRLLGAGFLAYLGLRSLWAAWQGEGPDLEAEGSPRSGFRDGLLTNLLNPKVLLFYLAFLPPLIPEGAPFLGLAVFYGLSHAAMGMAWLGTVALGAARLRPLLSRPAWRRGVEAAAGVLLLGFGIRLAFLHA